MVPVDALAGIRVIEFASEAVPLIGKQLAEFGADVIVVEPPGGHITRTFEPFVNDEPGPESSLWWAAYNTSKRSVIADIATESGRTFVADLMLSADVVVEAEPPGKFDAAGLGYERIRTRNPGIVWLSATPFGSSDARSLEPSLDLTILAGGGPVWLCGYDDHELPPVRGGGNQGYHIAATFGVMAALTALFYRALSQKGQLIDLNMHAAASVTTESGSFEYLTAGTTVQRQTGRHAMSVVTESTLVRCQDGVYVTTGFPPRYPALFVALIDWLAQLGLREEFELTAFLEMGAQGAAIAMGDIGVDVVITEIYRAGRAALVFLAENMTADAFFTGAQARGLVCGIIYSPDEVLSDPHFVERGFPTPVTGSSGRTEVHAGAPFIAAASPWRLRTRAPMLGEHQRDVFDELYSMGSERHEA
jgi:crotonobetainyl-CoA:carnitine CoA-transferase CaiB-like acyl-CoA transferase